MRLFCVNIDTELHKQVRYQNMKTFALFLTVAIALTDFQAICNDLHGVQAVEQPKH